jgi:hypothetical protein
VGSGRRESKTLTFPSPFLPSSALARGRPPPTTTTVAPESGQSRKARGYHATPVAGHCFDDFSLCSRVHLIVAGHCFDDRKIDDRKKQQDDER